MALFRKSEDVTRRSLWARIKDVALTDVGVLARGGVRTGSLDELEQLLLEADFGVAVTIRLVDEVKRLGLLGQVKSNDEFRAALATEIERALRAGKSDTALALDAHPAVILVVGVNGAGKTTLIGKLAARLGGEGKRVMVAAGDTFRAGAVDQLRLWAERAKASFFSASSGSDPASVAFDAIDTAIARDVDVLIVDTAGRLHTSDDLMVELKKIARVIAKRLPGAPHETLLVLDGTIGQNAVRQAQLFASAVPVSGIAVTKLDGTAKGGVVVAVHEAIDVPVKFIGVGEGVGDLFSFDAATFARELLEAE